LEHWQAGEPLAVRPPSLAAQLRFWLRQNFGSAGWMVVVGLLFGLLGGGMAWMVLVHPGLEQSVGAGYRRLPGLAPPRLAVPVAPNWVHSLVDWTTLGLCSAAGLIPALLVRPKNRAADVATGAVAGFACGTTAFILSCGWYFTILTAVGPAEADLRDLS